ncbi:MAG: hypothetical protein EXR75_01440 [Myxococcales bacterium]|nr:hypothetical protein [Myxococcales bacterium]
MNIKLNLGLFFGAVVGLAACGDDVGTDTAYEKWNWANDPSRVDPSFEYMVERLPIEGVAANKPIPGDYWPTYQDNLNVRWDGEASLSVVEKYEKAFGKKGLVDIVSKKYGIDGYKGSRKACKETSECSDLDDGSSCAKRTGQEEGVCIPTWWGICHGWAPYAISEPAPVKPAEYNGVTFYPGDIEGLMSLVYSVRLSVKFLSERCDEKKPNVGGDGRIAAQECRDMNPGSLHVVATNLLGIRKVGFVEDRTYDAEVWNQPVYAYRVTNAVEGKLKEVTKVEAVKLLGLADGSEYTYNADAERFFHVELDMDWIKESKPAHKSHVPELATYTRTDHYAYVLETDKAGKIQGGEYIGSSRESHPDFVWWPVGQPYGKVADGLITYDEVKKLNDLAKE